MTGTEERKAITRRTIEELLVDLALGRFRRRPPMSALPIGLRRDIHAFFGSDSDGCRRADERLFRAGSRSGPRRPGPTVGTERSRAGRRRLAHGSADRQWLVASVPAASRHRPPGRATPRAAITA